MVTLMPLLVFSAIAIYAFGLLRMVTAALEAPIGYEDADGYHYGIEVAEPEGKPLRS